MFEKQIEELLELKVSLKADEQTRIENAIEAVKAETRVDLDKIDKALDAFGYVEPVAEPVADNYEEVAGEVVEDVLPNEENC